MYQIDEHIYNTDLYLSHIQYFYSGFMCSFMFKCVNYKNI